MLIIIRKTVIIFALIAVFSFSSYAIKDCEISASSCVLIDADNLGILYEKNANDIRSMASTTKIMTTLLAVESEKLDSVVTVKDKLNIEGTAIGFAKGEKITLETLCYGMLLESGNDAAALTACFLAGSEEKFSVMMNRKAKEIGMNNTNFVTSSGLDAENHCTTAYDMALLGAYAVKNEKFREICSTKIYKAHFIESGVIRNFSNHNRLLNYCEGVYGIKTGFTKKSGRCLVTACERNGKNLVAVTLNAPDDWNDHEELYDYGYSLYECRELDFELPETVKVIGSDKFTIKISADFSNIKYSVKKDKELKSEIYISGSVYAPVKKNDFLGWVSVYCDGFEVASLPIVSTEEAEITSKAADYKPGFWQRLVDFICQLL